MVFHHTAAIILFGTANPVLLLSREDRVACRIHNWLDGQLHAGPFNIIWVLRPTKMRILLILNEVYLPNFLYICVVNRETNLMMLINSWLINN